MKSVSGEILSGERGQTFRDFTPKFSDKIQFNSRLFVDLSFKKTSKSVLRSNEVTIL